MNRRVLVYSLVLLFGVFVGSISQVLLKKAAQEKHETAIKEYLNFKVIFAYVLFVGTTLLSIIAYKGIPLSMGPILETTSYFYVTFFGVYIFKEKMTVKKYFSLALIIIGIVIYSFFGQQ